jgi:hypothetical protein
MSDSFESCHRAFKNYTSNLACSVCKSSNKFIKPSPTSLASTIAGAKGTVALSHRSFGCFSSKLLLESFHLLAKFLELLAVFRHHPFVLVHDIFIFRSRIDMHRKRSISNNGENLRVELLHKFLLFSLIFQYLELKNFLLHCPFPEKLIC